MKSRILVPALLVVGLLVAGLISRQKQIVPAFTQLYDKHSQTMEILRKHESALWAQLAPYGINQSDIENAKKVYISTQNIKPINHAVDTELIQLITHVCKDFGLDMNALSIEYCDDPCEASTDSDTVYINATNFKKAPEKARYFVIAHELQHIIFGDSIARLVLLDLLEHKNLSEDTIESLMNTCIKYQELRADIMASLKSEKYATGYTAFSHYILNLEGNPANPMYITNASRLALSQQISNELAI